MTSALSPGTSAVWRGGVPTVLPAFDSGTGGTPNVPKYGDPVGDTPSITGGPVSPADVPQTPSAATQPDFSPRDGYITLYHGTSLENAKSIVEQGFQPYQSTWFNTSPDHVLGSGRGAVVAVQVPRRRVAGQIRAAGVRDNYDVFLPRGARPGEIRLVSSSGGIEKVSASTELSVSNAVPDAGGAPSSQVIWEKLPSRADILTEVMTGINERGGITIDLTGSQPSTGYGYAPSKTTELMFEAGVITPEDVDTYIDSHFEELQQKGMHFGAWVSEEDGAVYLDVSRVGGANAETLRAAMSAEQLGIWDFGAPMELGELRVGRIDDDGKYIPLGDADEIHAQHSREVQQAIEKQRATATPPPEPEIPEAADALRDRPSPTKPPKQMKETPLKDRGSGPGASRKPATATESTLDALGKAGRVAGPILTAAGDIFMAYGLVDAAAEQGIADNMAGVNGAPPVPKGAQRFNIPDKSVLGIPVVKGYTDINTSAKQTSTAGRTPAELEYWAKHGKFPNEDDGTIGPGNGGASFDPKQLGGNQTGGPAKGLTFDKTAKVRHIDGTETHYPLRQLGPNNYEIPKDVKLRPGDEILLDGVRVR